MATLKPNPGYNSRAAAVLLRKAMEGFGTDEDAITKVMTKRICRERQEILRAYNKEFQRDLTKDFASELSGDFEKVILALSEPVPDLLARHLHNAVAGLGTNEDELTDILCALSSFEINAVSASYQKLFGKSLSEDVTSDVSGDYGALLTALLTRRRATDVNHGAAIESAKELYEAGEGQLGTNEEKFIKILSESSLKQLELICREYNNAYGKSFIQAVEKEISGDFRRAIETVVKFAINPTQLYAEHLFSALKGGLTTNDSKLIRILTWRAEIDLQNIKFAYAKNYGRSLESDIHRATSGDYGNALISILRGN